MGKSTHFIGQTVLCELTKYMNRQRILRFCREEGGECYVKTFNAWQHMVVMLYGVMERVFESVYHDLYGTYHRRLSSDSRQRNEQPHHLSNHSFLTNRGLSLKIQCPKRINSAFRKILSGFSVFSGQQ